MDTMFWFLIQFKYDYDRFLPLTVSELVRTDLKLNTAYSVRAVCFQLLPQGTQQLLINLLFK